MTLTELRYIVAVARERHLGHAAEACFVSQPTLSVAVKKLEEELGVALFERGRGEVTMTPSGQKIVEQAQHVLEEASRIKEIAASGRDPLAGPLRLGAIYTIGPYLLPKLIPILRNNAPSTQRLLTPASGSTRAHPPGVGRGGGGHLAACHFHRRRRRRRRADPHPAVRAAGARAARRARLEAQLPAPRSHRNAAQVDPRL